MAKVPKKPLKIMDKEKQLVKPIAKTKKIKKKHYQNYSIYIYKILRSVNNDIGITRNSISVMNSFVHNIMELLAVEAESLAKHQKKNTLGLSEIKTAIKLVIPGELGNHANIEAMKAVKTYMNSVQKE